MFPVTVMTEGLHCSKFVSKFGQLAEETRYGSSRSQTPKPKTIVSSVTLSVCVNLHYSR